MKNYGKWSTARKLIDKKEADEKLRLRKNLAFFQKEIKKMTPKFKKIEFRVIFFDPPLSLKDTSLYYVTIKQAISSVRALLESPYFMQRFDQTL
ncbi:hypothetical protein UB32_05470 [Mesobacillus subterraneus]|uniref:Uncharacterized protein n=2 Tax=Mesobacillus TaxID=2675231 RepID=A0A0D6ZEC6_9BACI|nr:hypothetical protein UB32_05470 [Mesobacillus subterraneus]MDQ0413618.1 16S rRNA G966 N2-methylase RsmD [Mesobacillus stamsii]